MTQTGRTAQAEIVQSGRDIVSGPNMKWMTPEPDHFPIEQMMDGQPPAALTTIDPALTLGAVSGSESYETPVNNAKEMLLRMIPFAIAWALLTWGIVWVLQLSAPFFLLVFVVLTAGNFWRMNLDGHEYSRNGLERFRVEAATQVRLDENAKAHELRWMALDGYLRSIERGQGQ